MAPTSAAGFTSPPLVGTWVSADQPNPVVHRRRQGIEVDLAGGVVVDDLDLDATGTGLDEPERVGDVFAAPDEHPVAGDQGHGTEGPPPRLGRIGGQSDLRRVSAEQPAHRIVHARQLGLDHRSGLVPTDTRFELEVVDDPVEGSTRR